MKVTDVVSEIELEMEESQNARDARVEALWKRLDYQGKGELDWKALQRGLKKIDHPLKNADGMLQEIVKVVDSDGDGKIQYEEFKSFVRAAERQLYLLFKTIDHDKNGKLDKHELQTAFQRAGLAIPMRRLGSFFEDIDMNNDGYISFDEWRDFLLFMPNQDASATLRAVFTFYSDIVTVSAEGDSVLNNDTLQSIGTTLKSLMLPLFGSIIRIASPSDQDHDRTHGPHSRAQPDLAATSKELLLSSQENHQQPVRQLSDTTEMEAGGNRQLATTASKTANALRGVTSPLKTPTTSANPTPRGTDESELSEETISVTSWLIKHLPDSGYFVAGAVAGGISRTATAPLDRLKVYLLVNTKATNYAAVDAAKNGRPLAAVTNAARSFWGATTELYRNGGLKGFFAGNGLNVIKIMPETAMRFGAYEAAKNTLAQLEGHGDTKHINPYSKFAAGGLAGMTAQFFVYPLDTLKFRLQSEYVAEGKRGFPLLLQTAKKMRAEGGLKPWYRGVTMGLIGMFPYSALDMGTFEFFKTSWITYQAKKLGVHEEDVPHPSGVLTGIMGATSGAFGASVVYPLNVLRTRLQTQGTSMHPARYTGIWDVAQKTLRNEGPRGLYKGLLPNLLKVAPALSITWIVYEKAKDMLELD
ncbi:mitochondrial carrier domain-containing protein [Truncatella angustata]|uniref:Mitochondrial thiamine pyrophosphate carrier 1 n=1 Tax=Truncatella angustata TaxID=152316 RepID=A0A9P9A153_9PEZI|nr:mitochondrial carrier domain-containing protein [Truncatella angustata]KAH6656811.1 mitochondrial carrier domain-containing protein [Truncatella angustata]